MEDSTSHVFLSPNKFDSMSLDVLVHTYAGGL